LTGAGQILMEKKSGIYAIINHINAKFYVGSAVNLAGRKRQHWHLLKNGKHHSQHLQAAWNKYGDAAFGFYPLFECEKTDLVAFEKIVMEQLRPEYNMALVAGSQLGMKHTDVTCAKMSETRKGLPLTPAQLAHIARLAEFNRGRKRAESEIAHLKGNTFARGGLGVKKHPGHGAKVSAGLGGNKNGHGRKGKKYGPQLPGHIAARAAGMRAYWAARKAMQQALPC